MVYQKDVKCYALSQMFLHENIFPLYPDIKAKMETECLNLYKKEIFKYVNEKRKIEITRINKKSVYRQIQLGENKEIHMGIADRNDERKTANSPFEIDESVIAEKIINQNLNENITDL